MRLVCADKGILFTFQKEGDSGSGCILRMRPEDIMLSEATRFSEVEGRVWLLGVHGDRISFCKKDRVLEADGGDDFPTACMYPLPPSGACTHQWLGCCISCDVYFTPIKESGKKPLFLHFFKGESDSALTSHDGTFQVLNQNWRE